MPPHHKPQLLPLVTKPPSRRKMMKAAVTHGVFYGISNSIIFGIYAAAFTYGTMLVANEEMKFFAVFRSVSHHVMLVFD